MCVNKLFRPLVFTCTLLISLLVVTSLVLAAPASATSRHAQGKNNVKYYCPGESREVTIFLNVNRPGLIAGSMWVDVNSIVTAEDANTQDWQKQIKIARNLLRKKLQFLAGSGETAIDVQFPGLQEQQHKSNEGYEKVTFSFSKHIRGVWEIAVPEDMATLNIRVITRGKPKTSSAEAGQSLPLII